MTGDLSAYFDRCFRDPAFWARQAELADAKGLVDEAAKCRVLEEKARHGKL